MKPRNPNSIFALPPEATKKIFLFAASLALALVLMLTTAGENFTYAQHCVLFLLFFAVLLWVTEAAAPFAVGVFIVGFLVFALGKEDGINVDIYVRTWSDGIIMLFLGGFFLAEGMKKTRLDYKLLQKLLPLFGRQSKYVLLGLMLATACISMLMSNTATTAMMIATAAPLYTNARDNFARALLLGIPAAASIGGMGTPVGSPPNAITIGALAAKDIHVSFLGWMIVGMPIAILLTFIFWRILTSTYQIGSDKLDTAFLYAEPDTPKEVSKLQEVLMMFILVLTLFLWLTAKQFHIPIAVVSGIPIAGLTLTGILSGKDVRALPWDTLMLVAGGLALGLAIEEHHLANYYVAKLQNVHVNFYLLVVLFALVTVGLSNFMSNTAATAILVPVALSSAALAGDANPLILPLVIGLSASCALFLPVSTPPNAIAYSTGLLKQSEFRLGGVSVGLIGPTLIIIWVLTTAHWL
ncbi:SLC13 family permease [Cardiobacterium valvarum]|uniref:Na(+)/dicarboxylate symporter n=2 Tax=Cardiobacterium valvarum TaxID=194702 RepID=A0A381EA65_9GAMM|nr:DASS family sodium-coupled anion symporter [Cardiobacterium valvarum]EHM55598.1 transporter, DASS family [Cardiobacterium valvarum F0432]SUX23918.1 Na(+)/dicarboxylate symporter [Cardiobacterium valvarum]